MTSSRRVVDLRRGRGEASRESPPPTARRSPKKAVPLRVRRRRWKIVVAVSSVLAFALVIWLIRWLSFLPEVTIRTIEVSGAQKVSAEALTKRVEAILNAPVRSLLSRRNIYLYPRGAIEEAIRQDFPRVKSVTIDRSKLFPTVLAVTIQERSTYAQWCVAGLNCFTIDEDGYVFAIYAPFVDALPRSTYVFYGRLDGGKSPIGQHAIPEHFQGLLTLLEQMRKAGFPVQSVSVDSNDLRVVLEEFSIKISFGQNVETLIKNLQLVLTSEPLKGKRSEIEYIDLRFDNRVYYKLKGEAEGGRSAL